MPTPTYPDQPVSQPAISPADAAAAIGRGSYTAKHLEALSDLSRAAARELGSVWAAFSEPERIALVRTLAEAAEENVLYLFWRVLRLGLSDRSHVVRQIAIAGLWEDESVSLIDDLISLMEDDESTDVRAESATALARFVDRGAVDELESHVTEGLRDALLGIASSAVQPDLVRRRALESVATFGGPVVHALISDAYDADDAAMRASAVYAMGRSLDRSWLPTVIAELESDDAELRYEAARASGELGHNDAVPALAELLKDRDAQVRQAAIGALGRIGGPGPTRILNAFSEAAPAADRELLDDAIAEAQLMSSVVRSGL